MTTDDPTLDTPEDDFILKLASRGPRKVMTAEGAAYFGQPVGTIITPDAIEAAREANEKKGVTPSKGMLAPTGGSTKGAAAPKTPAPAAATPAGGEQQQGSSTKPPKGNPSAGDPNTQEGYPAPHIDSTPPESSTAPSSIDPDEPLALGVTAPTLSGPESFTVGSSTYSAPAKSRLIQPKSQEPMAIVVTPDKEIHFFTEAGEVQAADSIKSALSERLGDKVSPDDSLYVEGSFEKTNGLETVQVGQHLYDSDGNKIFTKEETGFVHSDLGVPVSDKQIKPLFDSGELSPNAPSQPGEEESESKDEISFAAMDPVEFVSYVNHQSAGSKLYLPLSSTGKSVLEYYTVLTKDGADSWVREDTKAAVSAGSLSYLRDSLRTVKPDGLTPISEKPAEDDPKDKKVAKLSADTDELIEVPVVESVESLHVGDQIDQTITRDMLYEAAVPGTRVTHYPDGMSSVPDFSMTLGDTGEWESDSDFILSAFEIPESPLTKGSYWVSAIPGQDPVATPAETTAQEDEAARLLREETSQELLDEFSKMISDIESSTVEFPTEGTDGWKASELEIWEAISALESHSHGSPVYGLKTLSEDSSIRVNQEGLISSATSAFPGKSPKAAVLAYLKSKVEDTEDRDDPEWSPTLHLGEDTPKKNSFGLTGGNFGLVDVKDAISIIEGYEGKLYKSQLASHDNPLASLDFNSLVGPNKDKLQQKSDVLAYLRGLIPEV